MVTQRAHAFEGTRAHTRFRKPVRFQSSGFRDWVGMKSEETASAVIFTACIRRMGLATFQLTGGYLPSSQWDATYNSSWWPGLGTPVQGKYPPPVRVGNPPPPGRQSSTVSAMWWAVCLLRSRRRTFLFSWPVSRYQGPVLLSPAPGI